MPGGDDPGEPRQRGDSHGDPEGGGGSPGDVAGGGGGDDEQGGDQEDPHGVDRRGHHEGDDQREGDLHGRYADSLRPGESLVDPQQQDPVVEEEQERGNEQEEGGHPQKLGVGDGERVAVQERLQVPSQPLLPADDRDPEGDDRREKDADDRVRRKFGAPLYQGDGDGDDGAERGHRPGGGDAEEDPEGNAGEGGVTDRVGEEGHPVLDKRDAERGRGGGREEQREERALHERRFREREREQPVHQGEHAGEDRFHRSLPLPVVVQVPVPVRVGVAE